MTDTPQQAPVLEREDPAKVLFLDIDGVINSSRTYYASGGYPHDFKEIGQFDWIAIGLLQRLCKAEPRLRIVLSSSWRLTNTAEATAKAFDLPVIDRTPGDDTESRGEEIRQWLEKHPGTRIYAILDDNNWMLPHQQKRFVKTDPDNGLSFGNIKKLIRILEISERAFLDLRPITEDPTLPYKLAGATTVAKANDSGYSPLPKAEFLDLKEDTTPYTKNEAGLWVPVQTKDPYEK